MDPNPTKFPILSYLMSRLKPPTSATTTDIEQPPSPPPQLFQQMPHLTDPKLIQSMTQSITEISATRSVLQTLGDRATHEAVDTIRSKLAHLESNLSKQLEQIVLAPRPDNVDRLQWRALQSEKEKECRQAAENEKRAFKAVLQLDEMHEAYEKQLKDAEARLVKIYDDSSLKDDKGDDEGVVPPDVPDVKEEVNEEVVGLLQEASMKGFDRVELSGRKLRFLPEAFGKLTGLVLLNLSNNQLEQGMVSALDTLCSQAYGEKQYHMLGVHMQTAMFMIILMSIPISIVWAYTGKILINLGQDPEMSKQAGVYSCWLIPSIFAFGLLQCQIRFLQSQNNVVPMMATAGITTLIHVFVCWMLVLKYKLGNKGAALANAISYWINVVMLALYIKFSTACQKTWRGFSKDSLHDPLQFLRLAIPSALMICLEYWPYEILVLISGFLPNAKLETSMMTISFDTCSLVFRIPSGLSSAVSTRVSNELGAGHPQAASLAARLVLFMTLTGGTLVALALILVRSVWGCLYTNEEELVKYLEAIMPVLVISNFMDGIQGVLSGVARGCGWQNLAALVNLGAYYLVGLPSAIILTFILHVGGKGLWMGITCGSSLQAILFLIIMLRTNWEKEAKKARDRVFSATMPNRDNKNMHVAEISLAERDIIATTSKYHNIVEQCTKG